MSADLPKNVLQLLEAPEPRVVDGYTFLTLAPTSEGLSLFSAAMYLTRKRPDLGTQILPLCVDGTRALCVDLRDGNTIDPPLLDIDLSEGARDEPRPLGRTLGEWLADHDATARRFALAWDRVRGLQQDAGARGLTSSHDADAVRGKPTRDSGAGSIRNWAAVVNRVEDYIVGLAAFRFNREQGCLEVGEFLPIDQPHVEKGGPVRVLLQFAKVM